MRILYESRQRAFKTPFGALRQEEPCHINIHIPRRCAAMHVFLCIELDGDLQWKQEMNWADLNESGYDVYETAFSLSNCGLYFYYFEIQEHKNHYFLYRCNETETNIGKGDKWQLTCFQKDYHAPEGFAGKVMYQIFPDRFYHVSLCDLNNKLIPYTVHNDILDTPDFLPDENGVIWNRDFFGGNLDGIIKKLPYLEELGIGILYLNPIFMAYSNHRYDTADYMRIDPMLGTEEDFIRLCEEAHKKNIKVILDGVFSHTGSNSVYFDKEGVFGNGAFSSPASPFREWYDFLEYPGKYTSWWGIDTLPCVTEETPSFMDFIIRNKDSVVAHWLNCGADGFRLDVADELPDSFLRELHKRVKEIKPEAIVIGEVWEDASNKISYGKRRAYFTDTAGPQLDSVMNYPFREAILSAVTGAISPEQFSNRIMTILENYPIPVLDCLMNSLSTHDTPRILTLLGEPPAALSKQEKADFRLSDEKRSLALKREKAAAFLQFFLPGIPCIYYGDETGMQGMEDPFNRGYFKWEAVGCELSDFYRELSILKNKLDLCTHISFQKAENLVIFDCGAYTFACNVSGMEEEIKDQFSHLIYENHSSLQNGLLRLQPYGCAILKHR